MRTSTRGLSFPRAPSKRRAPWTLRSGSAAQRTSAAVRPHHDGAASCARRPSSQSIAEEERGALGKNAPCVRGKLRGRAGRLLKAAVDRTIACGVAFR